MMIIGQCRVCLKILGLGKQLLVCKEPERDISSGARNVEQCTVTHPLIHSSTLTLPLPMSFTPHSPTSLVPNTNPAIFMAASILVSCIVILSPLVCGDGSHSWGSKVDIVSIKNNDTDVRTIFLPKGSILIPKSGGITNNNTIIINAANAVSIGDQLVKRNKTFLTPKIIQKLKLHSLESVKNGRKIKKKSNNDGSTNKTLGHLPLHVPKVKVKVNADKVAKVLSLFTIVNFTNELCLTREGLVGHCYAAEECTSLAGRHDGLCAQGFGVCCYVERSCGSISAVNNTYVSGADIALDPHTGVFMCTVLIQKASPEVRQLRISLEKFELAGPVNGNCAVDSFVITGQNRNNIIPALCGSNSGKHVYVDVESSQVPVALTLLSSGARGLPRGLRLRVTQLAGDHPLLAPPHCLQFYTEPQGAFESFNYQTNNNLAASGYTNNLNYAICFKKLPGYCSIVYSNTASPGKEYPFELVNIDKDGSTVAAGQAGAEVFDCPDDYITVSGLRLCGFRLNDGSVQLDYSKNHPVKDSSNGPLTIGVRTNYNQTGRGFRLEYRLEACLGSTSAPPSPSPSRFPLTTTPPPPSTVNPDSNVKNIKKKLYIKLP